MKICPKCQKSYSDESLNFCLDDGVVLKPASVKYNEPPETVLINQPRSTSGSHPPELHSEDWNAVGQYQAPQQKNSKSLLWIAAVLGGLILTCGGGFVGLLFFISRIEKSDLNTNSTVNFANTDKTNSMPDDRKNITRVDLSNWNRDFSEFGDTDYKDGELIMNSNKDNFYYVLVAPSNYKTEDVTTKVTVRNINNRENNLGYGLLIHSDPAPLVKDYAFLINSKTQQYRIVTHRPQRENPVVNWTKSISIKTNSQENVLEVRDENDLMSFYINGDFITSVKTVGEYKNGVAGVYVGGASPVGFSNLEIRK